MPSLSTKDRVSLCLFTYEDGRRCRTPRISSHPHFCFYHAQKESQSQSTEKLAKEIAYFFSGHYLSACDLNAALGRLIPAVIRGEIKPRVARTVAYMFQTLMQSTRQAQHEYINAFSTDGWRDAISTSVKANHKYLHPPKPKQPTQSPVTSASSTPVGSRLVYTEPRSARPASPAQTVSSTGPERTASTKSQSQSDQTATAPPPPRPSPADTEAALAAARSIFPPRPNSAPPQPAPPTSNPPPQTAQPNSAPPLVPHPPQPRRPNPTRDPYEVHFDHTHRLRIDGKPW
jgi:hypothetical protein